jgi:hypothetical protein
LDRVRERVSHKSFSNWPCQEVREISSPKSNRKSSKNLYLFLQATYWVAS